MRAVVAAVEASLAPSALRRTVAVIWSRAAAVSSRLAACCSVRRDRSSDAVAISSDPPLMPSVALEMAPMASSRLSTAALKSFLICRYWPVNSASMREVRSPWARRPRLAARVETTMACSASTFLRSASVMTRSLSAAERSAVASVSRARAFRPLSLNTCTAVAIRPTSSRRSRPSTSTSRSPPARRFMRSARLFRGREILAVAIHMPMARPRPMPATASPMLILIASLLPAARAVTVASSLAEFCSLIARRSLVRAAILGFTTAMVAIPASAWFSMPCSTALPPPAMTSSARARNSAILAASAGWSLAALSRLARSLTTDSW